MSPFTKDVLDELGGYKLEFRGEVELKVSVQTVLIDSKSYSLFYTACTMNQKIRNHYNNKFPSICRQWPSLVPLKKHEFLLLYAVYKMNRIQNNDVLC